MQKNKRRGIPSDPRQNREAVLGQQTTTTALSEPALSDQKPNVAPSDGRVPGEPVAPIDRSMFPPAARGIPWDKYGVYVAIFLAAVTFTWYLASQDFVVKNLAEDMKELKKRSDETTRSMIESVVRLNTIEQRVSSVEQRGGPAVLAVRPPAPAASMGSAKAKIAP